jgi:peptidoglycan/xylan/chitin deacetylase (PgdA/CDA1 family)
VSRRAARLLLLALIAAGLTLPAGTAAATVPVGADGVAPAAAAVGATGGVTVPQRLKGTVWTRIPTKKKVVALTFDCGAGNAGTRTILDTLAGKSVRRATFFMTGTWAGLFPRSAKRVAADGYTVANHSMTHPDFTTLTPRQVQRELSSAQGAITEATGVSPRPWFRFPYGAYDGPTLRLVNGLDWVAIGWTIDTLGWQGTSGGQSVDSVVRRVVRGAVPGAIVLMHVGANPTDHTTLDADALATVIARLWHKGYRFVSVDALLH